MADTTNSDVLMYFVVKAGGDPIAAECASELVTGDKLTADFKTGCFFEAENFSFSMKLSDSESGEGGDYERWRAIRDPDVKPTPPFRAEAGDVSITRFIDVASPTLLEQCFKKAPFEKAVLVKRARAAAKEAMTGVLRMEFTKVWLKDIEWQDGDAIEETLKFKYETLKVAYVKRKVDGTTASSWSCNWSGVKNG